MSGMDETRDQFYAVLGIHKGASDEDIRSAYITLARKWHPDRNPQSREEANEQFQRIHQAYTELLNSVSSTAHMSMPSSMPPGMAGMQGVPGVDMADLFNQILGADLEQFLGTRPKQQHITFECTLEQLYRGDRRKFSHTKTLCDGSGNTMPVTNILEFDVEPGMADGHEILFSGEGDERMNGVAEDVVFVCKTLPHPVFHREGNDLIYPVTITLADALTGFTLTIEHLSGECVRLEVCDGEVLHEGSERRLMGRGMPVWQPPAEIESSLEAMDIDGSGGGGVGAPYGDLVCRFSVLYPRRLLLSGDDKALLRRLLTEQ